MARGERFPVSWLSRVSCLRMDDLVLAFVSGEPLVALGLELSSRVPDIETLLIASGPILLIDIRGRHFHNCATPRMFPTAALRGVT